MNDEVKAPLEHGGDAALTDIMRRIDTDLKREVGSCSPEEYRAFLQANLERAEADIAAGRLVSNDEVLRQSAERRKRLLGRLTEGV